MFNIGDKLDKHNYTKGAIWCNENNAVINPDTWSLSNTLPIYSKPPCSAWSRAALISALF